MSHEIQVSFISVLVASQENNFKGEAKSTLQFKWSLGRRIKQWGVDVPWSVHYVDYSVRSSPAYLPGFQSFSAIVAGMMQRSNIFNLSLNCHGTKSPDLVNELATSVTAETSFFIVIERWVV